MTPAQERRIRERAYTIWEQQGRPHGQDIDHWLAAERELAATPRKKKSSSPKAGAKSKRAASPSTKAR